MSFILTLVFILVSIILIILLTALWKFNAFISLLLTSIILALITLPLDSIVSVIMAGFGSTMQSIGLIIIFGIILGILMDESGATKSIARAILKLTGSGNAGLSVHLTGFITGIPIFCDSGFIVLHGINRKLVENTGKPMVFMATVLAAGLYPVHCLIPPHPGATAAAGIMEVNMGRLILFGIPVALVSGLAGFLWARLVTSRARHNLETANDGDNLLKKEYGTDSHNITSSIAKSGSGSERLPATWASFLPIVVPLLLLTGRSAMLLISPDEDAIVFRTLSFAGEPVMALIAGNLLALCLFGRIATLDLNRMLDLSVSKAGSILAITAAGGIFGAVIKATGMGETAGGFLAETGMGLFIPFLIAAFLKTAQGSSTIAMMTAASFVAPMLSALNMGSENGVLLATLAMGAGSMVVSHTNDSYFWVVTRFSELETRATLKVFTPATFVLGMTAFAAVLIISWILL